MHRHLQGVAEVRFPAAVEDRPQRRVRRIDLARVHLPALLGIGRHRDGLQKAGVLQMPQHLVEQLPAGRDPPGFEVGLELRHAEQAARVAEEAPHHPAQRGDVAHPVALDDIPQHQHVHIALQ